MMKSKFHISTQLILVISSLMISASCSTQQTQLEFTDYSNLKLGFTTQNFIASLPVNLDNTKMLIDYAADKGFYFIELRDPDAVLTVDECKEIAAYACNKEIEIIYSNQRGLLDPDFWVIFNKGIKNASAFEGLRTIRATISGIDFTNNPGKTGLTENEFTRIVEIANEAARTAEEKGMHLVVENGNEIFDESIDSIYGFVSFFKKVNQIVTWQFDTGNPFANKNTYIDPDTVKQYLETNAGKLKYIHLKSARNFQPQKILCDNDLDFNEIFQILSENDVNYIAIELFVDSVKSRVFENIDKSLEYLKNEEFIK